MKDFSFVSPRHWNFQGQLTVLFTLAVVLFAFVGVLVNSWNEGNRNLHQFIEQAEHITSGFAEKNILTLLYGANENTFSDIDATLKFPDVWQVSIHDKNNLVLVHRGQKESWEAKIDIGNKPFVADLVYEDNIAWHFVAPVYTRENDVKDESPFVIHGLEPEYLGFVHISFSKAGMNARYAEVLWTNIVSTMLFSVFTLILLLWLTSRMTKPLNVLSHLMKKAEDGEPGVRAEMSGPLEIKNMAHAFNSMMAEMEFKAGKLDEQNTLLIKEIEERKQAEAQRCGLQKQLQQAQKMEAIGQLTGGIAHDFNNMLASIMGYTGLAQERFGCDNDKLSEYLKEVNQASERARDLVAQMLAFSRGGTSQSQALYLEPLVKEAIKMLSSTMPSSIVVETNFVSDLPKIMMDPVQVQQIVMNLCINARDAMHGDGRLIVALNSINFERGQNCISCIKLIEGNYVELKVRDTGHGIDTDMLARVFDPFFTTKDIGKGTGMGLSMVHGIVHEHGGHILVESGLGKGTAFRLLFPSIQKKQNQKKENIHGLPRQDNKKNEVTRHILVVDDENSVARFLREFLQVQGYKVTVETDSESALALFKENPDLYDLVVTDQAMPKFTGMEMSKAMLGLRPELPIIMCTAYDKDIDESKAKAAKIGVQKYISKPVNPTTLLNIIGDLVEPQTVR